MNQSYCSYCGRPVRGMFCPHCNISVDDSTFSKARFLRKISDHKALLSAIRKKITAELEANPKKSSLKRLEKLFTDAIDVLNELQGYVRSGISSATLMSKVKSNLRALSLREQSIHKFRCKLIYPAVIPDLLAGLASRNDDFIGEMEAFEASLPQSKFARADVRFLAARRRGLLRKVADYLEDMTRWNNNVRELFTPSDISRAMGCTVFNTPSEILSPCDESQSAQEAPLDSVEFRIAAPKALTRGSSALVKFMMYSPDEYEKADRIAQYIADQVAQNVGSEVELERGTKLRVCLQSKDVDIYDSSREIVWKGRFSSCDFTVHVPETFSGKQIHLNARVYNGLAVLTDLKLILDATGEAVSEPAQKCKLTSAFLSYSSVDRSRVIACMRGMLLARDDMDIFIDVIKLRRGEHWEERIYNEIDQRDLFYLFWSRNAAQSEWVKKELEYALKTKGATAIEPVPLELPEICPPPAALNDRHFNDWMLLYELQSEMAEKYKANQE